MATINPKRKIGLCFKTSLQPTTSTISTEDPKPSFLINKRTKTISTPKELIDFEYTPSDLSILPPSKYKEPIKEPLIKGPIKGVMKGIFKEPYRETLKDLSTEPYKEPFKRKVLFKGLSEQTEKGPYKPPYKETYEKPDKKSYEEPSHESYNQPSYHESNEGTSNEIEPSNEPYKDFSYKEPSYKEQSYKEGYKETSSKEPTYKEIYKEQYKEPYKEQHKEQCKEPYKESSANEQTNNEPTNESTNNQPINPSLAIQSKGNLFDLKHESPETLHKEFTKEFSGIFTADVIDSMFEPELNESFATMIYVDNFIKTRSFDVKKYSLLLEWCRIKLDQNSDYDFSSQILLLVYSISIKLLAFKEELMSKSPIVLILLIIKNYLQEFGNNDWIIINKIHQCILLSGFSAVIYQFWQRVYDEIIDVKTKDLIKILIKTSKFEVFSTEIKKKDESLDILIKEEHDIVIKLSENPIKLQVFYDEKQENPDEITNEMSFLKEEEEFPLMLKDSVLYFNQKKISIEDILTFKIKIFTIFEEILKEKSNEKLLVRVFIKIFCYLFENLKENKRTKEYSCCMMDFFRIIEEFFRQMRFFENLKPLMISKLVNSLINRIIYETSAYLDYVVEEKKENTNENSIEKLYNLRLGNAKFGKSSWTNALEHLIFTIFEEKNLDGIIEILFKSLINENKNNVFSQNSFYYLRFLMGFCAPNDGVLCDFDVKRVFLLMGEYMKETEGIKFEETAFRKDLSLAGFEIIIQEITRVKEVKVFEDYESVKEKLEGNFFIIKLDFFFYLKFFLRFYF